MKHSILKTFTTLIAFGALLFFNSCNDDAVVPQGGNEIQNGLKTFDIDLFEQLVNDGMGNQWAGYAYVINKSGTAARNGFFGDRLHGTDGDVSSNIYAPMYAASINKTMTAAAMLRVLEEVSNGDVALFLNAKIFQYLPSNWQFGLGINNITFKDLLQHRTGFASNAATDYDGIRTLIAGGVSDDDYEYSNANYAIMRILIAIMSENVNMDNQANDVYMASQTLAGFRRYMDTEIFSPLDIEAQPVPFGPNPAKYYRFDALTNGWEIGDRSNNVGQGGYYISPVGLAKFLAYLNHSESIISNASRALMYQHFLGWSDGGEPQNAPLGAYGRYYFKAGSLCNQGNGSCTGQGVRNVIATFPENDVDIVIMANSRGGNMDGTTALRNMLMSAYDNAWTVGNN